MLATGLLALVFPSLVVCVPACPKEIKNVVDLSYPFNNRTVYWPGAKPFKHTVDFRGQKPYFYYEANSFAAAEHGGTDMDSPVHFYKGKWRLDQIPVERLYGEAVVIDVSEKSKAFRDYRMIVKDLEDWETRNGRIPDRSIVMVFNNWGVRWPNRMLYLGTDTNDTSLLHFPGVHEDAAKWLVENRKIYGIGIDTASIDYGQSKKFPSHQIIGEKNIYILENVANMDKLPPRGAQVYALPMKIAEGSGGPARIVAFEYKPCVSSAAGVFAHALLVGLIMFSKCVLF